MTGIAGDQQDRQRRAAVLTAVLWYAVPLAALLINGFVVPWETTSCADASGWCLTGRETMRLLAMGSAVLLAVPLAVSCALAGRLSRTVTSPIAAGTLAALGGLLIGAAGALVLYWAHAVDLV